MTEANIDSPPDTRVASSISAFFTEVPKGPMYLEEAEFGLRRMLPFLSRLPAGARVLEVGSGPCILLAEITERFPHLTIQGIEPTSDGFAFFDAFLEQVRAARGNIRLHEGGYESLPDEGPWDLIFLVNVFEHLPDWRAFLDFLGRSLAPSGRCVILCPNYGFPYESHFKLPVIINKRLTGILFRKSIDRFERENDNAGLYRSLNFVRLRNVRRAAREKGLVLAVDTAIIREMVERLDNDPAFRQRQRALELPAKTLRRTGLLDLLLRSSLVQDYLPYMQLVLSRRA